MRLSPIMALLFLASCAAPSVTPTGPNQQHEAVAKAYFTAMEIGKLDSTLLASEFTLVGTRLMERDRDRPAAITHLNNMLAHVQFEQSRVAFFQLPSNTPHTEHLLHFKSTWWLTLDSASVPLETCGHFTFDQNHKITRLAEYGDFSAALQSLVANTPDLHERTQNAEASMLRAR